MIQEISGGHRGPLIDTACPLVDTGGALIDTGGPLIDTRCPLVDTGGPLADIAGSPSSSRHINPLIDIGGPPGDIGRPLTNKEKKKSLLADIGLAYAEIPPIWEALGAI